MFEGVVIDDNFDEYPATKFKIEYFVSTVFFWVPGMRIGKYTAS
jgi:hypothetical protein